MEETTINALKQINPKKAEEICSNITAELIGKGLSFLQATALLDYSKEFLKNVKI